MITAIISWNDYLYKHAQITNKDKLTCNKQIRVSYTPTDSIMKTHQTILTQFLNKHKHKQIKHIEFSNINFDSFDLSYLFAFASQIQTITLINIDISHVTSLCGMFHCCVSLNKIILSNFAPTHSVTNMSYMFSMCCKLSNVDLSRFNTTKLITTAGMFQMCLSLKHIQISKWNTSQLTDTHWMFYNCSSLTSIDLSQWNVSQLTNIYQLFHNCKLLKQIYIDDWKLNEECFMDKPTQELLFEVN